MGDVYIYKDYIVDLKKVAAVEMLENEITFFMDGDMEFTIPVDEKDFEYVKRELVKKLIS